MALQNIWKIHSIEVVPDAGSPLQESNATIGGITNVGMPVNATATKTVTAGNVFATTGFLSFTTVDLSFTSTMAKAMLDLVGIRGACLAPGGDLINVYAAKYDCAGPAAGAVHRRYKITKGMLYITGTSCDHQGDLQVSAQLQAVFDGTNSPVVIEDNVALPSDAQIGDLTGAWTLSEPADNQVGGVTVGQKRSVNIDMGVSTSTEGADSDPFDSFAAIDSVQPVVSAAGVNPEWFDTLGLSLAGKLVNHANTSFGFRKRDGAGGFVPNNIAEHILITAYGPAYYDELLSASGVDAATASFKIECLQDATGNAPLIINTASVLS